jgi:hypothetical protein
MAPQTGRWLTPDPPVKAPDARFMSAPWKLHPYQYVEQNPLVYWDPDGRDGVRNEMREDRDAQAAERDTNERRDTRENRSPEGWLGHFNNDWAGREILERYLTGEGDWDIDSEVWARYMQANGFLEEQVANELHDIAQPLTTAPDRTSVPFYRTFAAEVENGEGIIGYDYLHGTNARVGGFQMWGVSTVRQGVSVRNRNGTVGTGTSVTMTVTYRWNDMIDPNRQYSTDRWKSTIAAVISLGQAEDYRISISWTTTATFHFDANGKIQDIDGWPGGSW